MNNEVIYIYISLIVILIGFLGALLKTNVYDKLLSLQLSLITSLFLIFILIKKFGMEFLTLYSMMLIVPSGCLVILGAYVIHRYNLNKRDCHE